MIMFLFEVASMYCHLVSVFVIKEKKDNLWQCICVSLALIFFTAIAVIIKFMCAAEPL